MNSYISLLRGINVSGQKKMRMVKLRGLYEAFGFTNVQTYLQSGNVAFDSASQDAAEPAEIIENKLNSGQTHAGRLAADASYPPQHDPFE